MNICTECQYCHIRTHKLIFCTRLEEFASEIDGKAITRCDDQRFSKNPEACGREGKFFVRRKTYIEKIFQKLKKLVG